MKFFRFLPAKFRQALTTAEDLGTTVTRAVRETTRAIPTSFVLPRQSARRSLTRCVPGSRSELFPPRRLGLRVPRF
jgi:hypothetical protein